MASLAASMASEADVENLDYRYLDLWEFGCLEPLLECIFALISTSSSSFFFLMPFFKLRGNVGRRDGPSRLRKSSFFKRDAHLVAWPILGENG